MPAHLRAIYLQRKFLVFFSVSVVSKSFSSSVRGSPLVKVFQLRDSPNT